MPETIVMLSLKLLGYGLDIIPNLVASTIWEKLNQDLERVIFKLIQAQYRSFREQFPDAVLEFDEKSAHPAIAAAFGSLSAEQLAAPIEKQALESLLAQLWLKPSYRETEIFDDIDPKYRRALSAAAQDFIGQFKQKATGAFERNSAAATAVLLNSLAQSGQSDAEILRCIQELQEGQQALPNQLSNLVAAQLLPGIRIAIQNELNRFRADWPFILQVLRNQVPRAEQAEREWLEYLAQVMEWKGFKILARSRDVDLPGELFEIEDRDRFGNSEKLVCWGCPSETCPDKHLLKVAIATLKERPADAYFIISQAKLDASLAQYLRQQGIPTHKTLNEFVLTLLDISEHRKTVVGDYQRQPIYHNYVDLYAHHSEAKDQALELKSYFYAWLGSGTANHLSLLGNFGTGKTEFCRRMQWELLTSYDPAKNSRIPILITLRDHKGLKLAQMLDSTMNRMGLKQIDSIAFRVLNRMGLFVVLIDGFDEMATYANIDEMIDNFRELAVLAEGRAKVCITCRTHYFEHQAREQEILSLPEFIAERPDFRILYLNLFNREQIETYLDRVQGLRKSKHDILHEMDQHARLQELMQTPVLLDMILKIFPDLMDADAPITPALIYKTATDRWIAEEKKHKHLQKLNHDEVIRFMQDLAWQMHQEDTLAINYKKLKSRTRDNFKARIQEDPYELDGFYKEIRTCTFLTRDSLGDYKFAHKSFMEYFTAAYLAPKLLDDTAPEVKLNEEIRQFTHYLILPRPDAIAYASDPRFQFQGKLPDGMQKCAQHANCFIHLKDHSEMVWIPPGLFIAGGEMFDQEKPTRILRLEQGAFLDKYLVTNAQYAEFLNKTGRFEEKWLDLTGSFKGVRCRIQKKGSKFDVETGFEQHPVNFVSYYGAEAYAKWVGKEIPSEWLWEKAGRGIDGRTYPWGEDWDWEKCNTGEYWAKRDLRVRETWEKWRNSKDGEKAVTTPVDFFVPLGGTGPFGCCDLSGNLWEWMKELWKKGDKAQVVRGAAFDNDQNSARLAYRNFDHPETRYSRIGFRLSRTS